MSSSAGTNSTPIIVIADDLSGAAELAGIAFAQGLSAEVQREFDAQSAADVIAVDTDSRHLSADESAERLRQVAEKALLAQPAWIFKKVDSVLRGNVRVEIEAILRATGQPRAILIPANPSRGRTIVRGRYFIGGVPLDQTAFAHDPDHPRLSADVHVLLGPTNDVAGNIVIPNVASPADVEQLAARCEASTIAAGAADFFTALLRQRCPERLSAPALPQPLPIEPPVLLVCGSRASWPSREAACRAAGILVATIELPLTVDHQPAAILLGIGEPNAKQSEAEYLGRLAKLAAGILKTQETKTLFLEGGATAAAIASEMGWSRFSVVASAPTGVGVLRPQSHSAPLVLIKPGSYPWPDEIWQAFCR